MRPDDSIVKLQRLEASVAHLERMADQLNEALIEQGRQLTRLQKRLEILSEALNARTPPPGSERPPHYGR